MGPLGLELGTAYAVHIGLYRAMSEGLCGHQKIDITPLHTNET